MRTFDHSANICDRAVKNIIKNTVKNSRNLRKKARTILLEMCFSKLNFMYFEKVPPRTRTKNQLYRLYFLGIPRVFNRQAIFAPKQGQTVSQRVIA